MRSATASLSPRELNVFILLKVNGEGHLEVDPLGFSSPRRYALQVRKLPVYTSRYPSAIVMEGGVMRWLSGSFRIPVYPLTACCVSSTRR